MIDCIKRISEILVGEELSGFRKGGGCADENLHTDKQWKNVLEKEKKINVSIIYESEKVI